MAYISAADVKVIRNELKVLFPLNQGWKFSVRGRDHQAVEVTVLQAPVDLLRGDKSDRGHINVNHYWLADHYTGRAYGVLKLIADVISRKHWDKSDIQTDYFSCAFYYNMHIGAYDVPFVHVTPNNIKSKTKWSITDAKKRFKQQTVVNLLVA